jgi:hypothetical protein
MEVIVGGLLLIVNLSLARWSNLIAALIYFGFFLFAIYGLGAGIEGDCGCFGDPDSGSILATLLGSEFGWKMVIRNGIFLMNGRISVLACRSQYSLQRVDQAQDSGITTN